jgi:hypothetical protein
MRDAHPGRPDGLRAIDRWTLGYVAFAAAAIFARTPRHPDLLPMLAANLLLAAVALAAPAARRRGGAAGFLGDFYPLLADLALYGELGLVNSAAGVSHDAVVQRWEEALLGGQVSRAWIRAWPSPCLSWVLHLGYLSYYPILGAAPLGLWLSGRRDAARRTLLLMMVGFYVCYAISLTFPVAGPRYVFPLARNAAAAVPPAVLTQRLLDGAAAWGTAFPSSHVAVSMLAALSALREWRPLGVTLLPPAILLTLGTVYGQLHYGVDALAGLAIAAAVYAGGAAVSLRGCEGA